MRSLRAVKLLARRALAIAWLLALGCSAQAPATPGPDAAKGDAVQTATGDTAGAPTPVALAAPAPIVAELRAVVPGPGLPTDVSPQSSNNNLDIARVGATLLFAFRTAPDHFAGPHTRLHVVATQDEKTWTHEASYQLKTDLREPRLLVHKGRTFLYFAVLGSDAGAFEPQGTRVSERLQPGQWTEPKPVFAPTFIPWRVRSLGAKAWLVGYTGGGNVYQLQGAAPVVVHWFQSDDGAAWLPAGPTSVVLEGGASETDVAFLDDGAVVAVARNERGDASGFGSKVCRGDKATPYQWTCKSDKRKYDSPLLFRHGPQVYLIGRRNLSPSGDFDLGSTGPLDTRYLKYQLDYWLHPKRCALWRVDPVALTVTHVLDLPSRGDTCFASLLPIDARTDLIYNYSSPLEGPDLPWLEGQQGPTLIYRHLLQWP
ncbi:MAG: hypothetical protein EXR79_13360 [Myxococcales bacterium]|nr:hypothetical protein [Myxococcales bacterium]